MNKYLLMGLLVVSSVVSAGSLTVNNGASFTGTGNLTGDLVVKPGGNVAPSSGCLSVDNTDFNSGSSLSITIAGTTECGNYSQLQVNGTADLSLADLNVVTDNYTLQVGDEFIILANDGVDGITNTFNQLPENTSFSLDGNDMYMSYQAGDGNDAGFGFILRYDIEINVTGLAATNSVSFANGTDTLTISSNTVGTISTLDDNTAYSILVTSHPDTPTQTCGVTSANGASSINGADVMIDVYCNTEQNAVVDVYTAFEDITLVANDANGSVNGVNDNGVLVNDNDVDGDILSIVAPNTYTATGVVGGEVTIAADGTFSYIPTADLFGNDLLNFNVTDGVHTVGSSLTIEVLPVNDAPTFSIVGNILSAELHPDISGTTLIIPQFAFDMDAGADNESSQTLQFNVSIFADSSSVLVANGASITNAGELTLDYTGNFGVAIIQLTLKDNGLTPNGGEDTSAVTEFVVSYRDGVFSDGFEEPVVMKSIGDFNKLGIQSPLKRFPTFDPDSNVLLYDGHKLKLDDAFVASPIVYVIKQWINEIDLINHNLSKSQRD